MQMYCSDVSGWLCQADPTESYVQGPRIGKYCKLKVQNFSLLLFSLLEYAVHKMSYIRSKFLHFSISSNINS